MLVLTVIGFSLIPSALFAEKTSELPACCRRDGKHHCASMAAKHTQPPGVAIAGLRTKCPLFPAGGAVPASGNAVAPVAAHVFVAPVAVYPTAAAQTEAQYRVSFSRSSQKRGPPSLL